MEVVLMNGGTPDTTGLIPFMLDEEDPRPAREQFDERYQHGGGWRPMGKFTFDQSTRIMRYPGDPPMKPRALMLLHDEQIIVYDYGFVAIVQANGNFEVARMD